MSNSVAILLMAFIAGVPILLMILFVTRQIWKKIDWKSIIDDLPNLLMVLGGIFALGLLLTCWTTGAFVSQEQYLSQPDTIVSGTIEQAEHHFPARLTEILSVKVDGKWYSLILPWGQDTEITAAAGAWIEESIGQEAEFVVYPTSLTWKVQEFEDGFYINRGEIFGVTDSKNAVLLDADSYRLERYLTEHDGIELAVGSILFFALLFVAGLILKLMRKR